jgi:hypothetical protein
MKRRPGLLTWCLQPAPFFPLADTVSVRTSLDERFEMNIGETCSEGIERMPQVPRFRWRIIPATILLIFGSYQFSVCSWKGIVALRTNPASVWLCMPMWIAGIVWITAAVACHQGWWWRATLLTIVGYVLPELGLAVLLSWAR